MRVWFIRSNGETAHNNPATSLYVPGEPPIYPQRRFNYANDCLQKGFARVGWPGTGTLASPGWRQTAAHVYGGVIHDRHVRYLTQFREISPADVVLLPAYRKAHEVFVGVVISPRNAPPSIPGSAYYYHHDVPARDWYENAHRVDVKWVRTADQKFAVFDFPHLGGVWLRGFGEIKTGAQLVRNTLAELGIVPL